MTKEIEKKKEMSGKKEKCIKKKNGRKRARKMDRNKREEIKKCCKTWTDRNIDLLGKKVSIFCPTHIAVGHRI